MLSETCLSLTQNNKQLSSTSSFPYQTPKIVLQKINLSSTAFPNTCEKPPRLSNPPPLKPIRHSSGHSKPSMTRVVVVPDIEKELNFLKYHEVNSPGKPIFDYRNNGFIDCFAKFLKVYLILFSLK